MKPENEIFLIGSNTPSLNTRPEIVHPPEATALAAPTQPRPLRQRPPPPSAFLLDVVGQQPVFLWCPWASPYVHLATTRCSSSSSCGCSCCFPRLGGVDVASVANSLCT
uniref:MYB family protein n=1 Tax=Rhizophora mucronata TaxID=61149 RepID=A0A2P2P090_RHIMU